MRYGVMTGGPSYAIRPRLDPIAKTRRLDPYGPPPVLAYLEGRPVVLARPDPRNRRPGVPANLTVPLTLSRYQHALDIERGYDPAMWEPTPLWGLGRGPSGRPLQLHRWG